MVPAPSINILVLITILLAITLVFKESKEFIVKFVTQHNGTANDKQVVDYMTTSTEVPAQFRTSRVTTLKLIDELDGDRIRVQKGERRGQSHRLWINDKSWFDWINRKLSKVQKDIKKMDLEESQIKVKTKNGMMTSISSSSIATTLAIVSLCELAKHTSRHIKNENDQRVLNDKILQAMVDIGVKTSIFTLGRLTKKLTEQVESH